MSDLTQPSLFDQVERREPGIDVSVNNRGVLIIQQYRNRKQVDDFLRRASTIVLSRVKTLYLEVSDDCLIFPEKTISDEIDALTRSELLAGFFGDTTMFKIKICFSFSSSFAFVYVSYNFGGDNIATILIHEFKFIRG